MSAQSAALRQLGKNGPKVPALGFGLMTLAGAYGTPPSDEERFLILDRAVQLGSTFWDSSDIYGDSEEMLGKWLKRTGKRDQVFLATKFGIVMENFQFRGIDSSAEYCKKACEQSLKKLGVDCIDLYYAHRLNPGTPVEETMRALAELKAEGKIKYIGLSEVSSATLRRACKIAHVAAVQMEYSPFEVAIERESGTNLLKTCRELGVAVICYSPLGRGLLTGTISSIDDVTGAGDTRTKHIERFTEENLEANIKIANQFKALADKKGCTATQLALAWILKQGDDMIPIPGTKKIKYLEENWDSLNVHLTDEEDAEIRKFVDTAQLSGYRSMPSAKMFSYVNTKEEA
ncbi:Aldo/keto reductase [Lojkania enalia]|uniref:Aldo/keto reductase n=1 Tax=Lojkania enalia TaxID=147567 RepID=A0A9P4MVI9_9PLEO|nr:Aldo/keto reductase [Didymosphaeria enalia]